MIKFEPDIFSSWDISQDEESVCLLFGRYDGDDIVVKLIYPVQNVWRGDRHDHYTFHKPKSANARAEELNCQIVGHCHTHIVPRLKPSQSDYEFLRPNELGLVLHTFSGRLIWYRKGGIIQKDKIAPPLRKLTSGNEATGTSGARGPISSPALSASPTRAAHNGRKDIFRHRFIPPPS